VAPPPSDIRQYRAPVAYELSALLARREVLELAADKVGEPFVEIGQGLGLLPIIETLFARFGGEEDRPFGDLFRYLSSGVERVACEASSAGLIAYVEAEMFGGAGTQATVVWHNGTVSLGPVITEFGWPPPDVASRPAWAINAALRSLGAVSDGGQDEFDAVGLGGSLRHTNDWQG
jgi:hypothetical protein